MASGRSHRRGGYGRGPGGALRVLTVALALLAVPGLIHGTAGQMRPAPSPAGRAVIRLGGTLPPTRPFGATTTSWSGTALLGTTIVGAQPTSVTYDSGNHYLYVTNFGNPRGCGFPLCGNTVSIVSDANNTQVAAVAVGDDPLSGVYDPTNGFVYILNYGLTDNVSVINGTHVIANVGVGATPATGTYDPANGFVYVPNFGSGTVSIINGTRVVTNLTVGSNPYEATFDPRNDLMYVADSGSDNVSILNGTSVVGNVTVGTTPGVGPYFSVYDAANGYVYVANPTFDNVSVLNGTRWVATLDTGPGPYGLVYDPVRADVLVLDAGANNVTVLHGTSNVANVTIGVYPREGTFDPNNDLVYISDWTSNAVSVLNGTDLIASIAVGQEPRSATFDPHNGEVYVADYAGENMSEVGTLVTPYAVHMIAHGLEGPANWSATLGATTFWTGGGSLAAPERNGSMNYSVGPPPGYWAVRNGSGTVNVSGANATVNVTFAPIYAITFTATGLAPGTFWSVAIGNESNSTAASSLELFEPNGSYTYHIGILPGYEVNATGTVLISAAPASVAVRFVAVTYPVTFGETGLPSGLLFSVRVGSSWENTTTGGGYDQVVFNLPNGTYIYRVQPLAGWTLAVGSYQQYVTVNNTSVSVNFVFVAEEYPIQLYETGLPAGLVWNVSVGSLTASRVTDGANDSILVGRLSNGTYPYAVGPVPGWEPALPEHSRGNFMIDGGALLVGFTYVPATYTVTLSESGLPAGTTWQASLDGGIESVTTNASGAALVFRDVLNGSHFYRVLPVVGWSLSSGSPTGDVSVQGTDQQIELTYRAFTYAVTFSEVGLPAGTAWNVTLAGTSLAAPAGASGSNLSFQEPNGSYAYTLADVPGWHLATPGYSGTVRVAGGDTSVGFEFLRTTYALEFVVSGLPLGTPWSVEVAGIVYNSTGSNVTLGEPNGSYAYSVAGIPGYRGPANGTVEVAGAAPPPVALRFAPASTAASSLTGWPVWAGVGAVAFAAAALLALLVIRRRRRSNPPYDEPTGSGPEPAPSDEAPTGPADASDASPGEDEAY